MTGLIVTGPGPHMMSSGDWILLAGVQVGLVLLEAFAVWVAVRVTRPGSGT